MTQRDRWIHRHLRQLHLGQFLQKAVEWVAIYLLGLGTAVLVVKLLMPGLWPHVLWTAIGVVPVIGLAAWASRTGRFTRVESVALLDQSLGAGGLLMTLTEAPDAEWESRLPQVERQWRDSLPRIRTQRLASSLALPLLFAGGACLVPLREIAAQRVVTTAAGQRAANELENLLQMLEEAEVLDEHDEQALEEAIEKLQEETENSPLTHEKWETVDSLEQRMRMKLDEAHVDVSQAAQAAAILAMASGSDGTELSAERREQLEQEVLETLQKISKGGGLAGASGELKDALQRLSKSGTLRLPQDAAERDKLMGELSEFLDQESTKLAELRAACQSACQKCGSKQCEAGECEGGQCAACGAECQGGLCSTCSGNRPGRGGVSRGRGDAALTWGEESDEQGVKFKESVLPPGIQDSPKEEVLSVTPSAPEADPAESASRGASRTLGPSAGGGNVEPKTAAAAPERGPRVF